MINNISIVVYFAIVDKLQILYELFVLKDKKKLTYVYIIKIPIDNNNPFKTLIIYTPSVSLRVCIQFRFYMILMILKFYRYSIQIL